MDDKQLQQEFIQFLGEQLQAKDQKDLEKKIQNLGQDGLKKYYDAFVEHKKKKAQKAAHGAKLNYFRNLKNICAEDEELQYFKKGGSVDCGCVKKAQEGTKTQQPKKQTEVEKFRQDRATRDSIQVNKYNDQEIQVTMPGKYETKNGKTVWVPDRTKAPYKKPEKKSCGGFMKKSSITVSAKGAKVCPKCGKVHAGKCK